MVLESSEEKLNDPKSAGKLAAHKLGINVVSELITVNMLETIIANQPENEKYLVIILELLQGNFKQAVLDFATNHYTEIVSQIPGSSEDPQATIFEIGENCYFSQDAP